VQQPAERQHPVDARHADVTVVRRLAAVLPCCVVMVVAMCGRPRYLFLNDNQLNGTLPASFSNLTSLQCVACALLLPALCGTRH
jgi:hypothetical protein